MKKKLVDIALVIGILIPMIAFAQFYQDAYLSATPDFQNLYGAIFAGGVGVFIHFFKNHSLVKGKKNREMVFESFELLILIFIPAAVSFNILKNQHFRCKACHKKSKVWDFDHINGDSSNNSLNNCQALCPNCHAEKSRIKKQKSLRLSQIVKKLRSFLKK